MSEQNNAASGTIEFTTTTPTSPDDAGTEQVFDIPWNQVFDGEGASQPNRSHVIYRGVHSGFEAIGGSRFEIDAAATRVVTRDSGEFRWHYGAVTGLGFFSSASGREVVIVWDEGGASRAQSGISDSQWEIFKLAFERGFRIAILSDKPDPDWKFDYRYLESQK